MSEVNEKQAWWKSDFGIIGLFAAIKLIINGAFITRYGFQRDELYFIACGRHLSFGYVDHGPMVPWIARLSQALFGESIVALRIFPLLAGALSVVLAGLLVRELGGKRWAQAFACAAMVATPAYLRTHSILHIPTFEMIYWSACFLIFARVINRDEQKLWLLFGVIAGIGLLNKPTVLFLGCGIAAGLVLTPARRSLTRPWVYAGGAIALAIFVPNLIWQYQHDWATYRFVSKLNAGTMQHISRLDFLLGQVLYMGPLNVFLWIPGLIFLLFLKRGKPWRALGIVCVTVFTIMIYTKAKVYYLAPVYPVLYAAGAVLWEATLAQRRWVQRAAFAIPVAGFIWLAPMGLPMLPVEDTPATVKKLTGGILDLNASHEVTNDWRDQYGWKEQTAVVAQVFKSLTPEEQSECVVFVGNYGEAAAIDFYGKRYGLPDALSPHMTYYYWGPGTRTGSVAIAYNISRESLQRFYDDVQQVGMIENQNVNKFENHLPVYLCRSNKTTIQEAWKQVKRQGF